MCHSDSSEDFVPALLDYEYEPWGLWGFRSASGRDAQVPSRGAGTLGSRRPASGVPNPATAGLDVGPRTPTRVGGSLAYRVRGVCTKRRGVRPDCIER